MLRKTTAAAALVIILLGSVCLPSAWAATVGGTVFEDANGDGSLDVKEKPLIGVVVSDGKAVTRTGLLGRYQLETEADLVFVSVPGTHHAADNKFYRKIDSSAGGKQEAGMPSSKFGSGQRLSHTSRWLAGATPGNSPVRPNRSPVI